jgi:invasion protein IalB
MVVKGDDAPNAQPWTLDCSNRAGAEALTCVMSQVLYVKSTAQRAIGVTIFRPDPKGSAMMRISLPHGISLPDGVNLWVDSGQPTKHVIAIADQNGSYSTFELDGTLILMLKAGHVLNLGVKLPNGQSIDFQMSLKGFSNAFDKV